MQQDFDDLRFVYYNKTTGEYVNLPYWIESFSPSNYALVWVKVPFIPSNTTDIGYGAGIQKIWVYYGDPVAINQSNGDATFIFFDDFSKDLSKWNNQVGAIIENGSLKMPVGNKEIYSLKKFNPQSKAIEFKIKFSTSLNGWGMIEFYQDGTNLYRFFFDPNVLSSCGELGIAGVIGGSVINCKGTDFNAYVAGEWYRLSFRKDQNITLSVIDLENTTRFVVYSNESFNALTFTNISIHTFTLDGNLYLDFIALRNYIHPEPIVKILLNEEKVYSLSIIIRNPSSVDLEGLQAVLYYQDRSRQQISFPSETLQRGSIKILEIKNLAEKPKKIMISAQNCPIFTEKEIE